MKVFDLFSGIGGFSLGFESTGYFQTTKFVEMDKYCQKILRKNFPGIPIEEDIRNVKGKEFEADVITGGFPCQPFSVAGRQKGTSDDRYLWPEMFRLIKEIKPKWVVGENVSGLINLQDGLVLRQVQDDLEGEGFEVQCFIIPASGIGAWHQRKRVWIVAHSERNGQLASKKRGSIKKTISEKQEGSNHSLNIKGASSVSTTKTNVANAQSIRGREPRDINKEERNKESIPTQSNSCGKNAGDVSNTNIKGLEGYNGNSSSFKATKEQTNSWSKNFSQQSGQQKTWWEIESNLCGVPNGISYELDKARAPRIKALGNSIVPQIARQIALSIIHAEEE